MKRKRVLTVSFATTKHIPANEVTVSCKESLSSGAIKGEYIHQRWQYRIPLPLGVNQATLCFKINGNISMNSAPIVISENDWIVASEDQQVVMFTDKDISFPNYEKRYCHGIERLLNEETDFTRRYVPSNLDTSQNYDVIIIGSGMGGGILADQLSDSGVSVLVLEAGSVHLPSHIGNSPIPASEVDARRVIAYNNHPDSQLTKDVHMNLGGRSIYWSALIPRMNKWDYLEWDENGNEIYLWDKKIVEYLFEQGGYTKTERLFRMRTEYSNYEKVFRAWIENELPDYGVKHLPRSYHQELSWITMREGNPDERPRGYFSTAALLLNSVSYSDMKTGGENITINLNHLVTKLEHEGSKVTKVICQDLINHKKREYSGRVVILAAGATASPCIAQQSELNDLSKKIGIGLTDHQSAELEFVIPLRGMKLSITSKDQVKLLLLPNQDPYSQCPKNIQNQFSCELAINPRIWEPRYEDDDLYNEAFENNGDSIRAKIKFLFPRKLNDKNWVKFLPDKTCPTVRVAPMEDFPQQKEAEELKKKIFEILGVDSKDPLKYRTESETYHTGGSLRIGEHGEGVVDTNLKFHEYDNLYCCDLSVFPHIPTANPSLTLGALALRLAEHIAADLTR